MPTVFDKIIQECARIVLEPIAEGKFFPHSYGFRPMRSCDHAVARVVDLINRGCGYIAIEGDIKGYFDHINHNRLLSILWNMGIKDKRFLMIIKKMLKAGVMEDGILQTTELGSPQGGIISPLLANIYLNDFDWMISDSYETHPARYAVKDPSRNGLNRVRRHHEPAHLIRYADDWVIICKTEEHAQRLLKKIDKYFQHRLKLELSKEKTLITDMRKKPIKFLGFHISARKARLKNKIVGKPVPITEKFRDKVQDILKEVKALKKCHGSPYDIAAEIEKINAKIVGVTNYFKIGICTDIFCRADKALYDRIRRTLSAMFRSQRSPKNQFWVKADAVSNRRSRHAGQNVGLWAYKVDDIWIGFTRFSLTKSSLAYNFDQSITPYTQEGRTRYELKYGKRLRLARETFYSPDDLKFIAVHMADEKWRRRAGKLYNFEFVMNREYAFIRDRGKCKLCKTELSANNFHCHHISPWLLSEKVNKVSNLASVCIRCHHLIHSNFELEGSKFMLKVKKYREKLVKEEPQVSP